MSEKIYNNETFKDIHTLASYFCDDLARQRAKYKNEHGIEAPDSELILRIAKLDKPEAINFEFHFSYILNI